VTNTIRKETRV